MNRTGLALASGTTLCLVAWTSSATAQIHADFDLEAGAADRVVPPRQPALGTGIGPMFELEGHVAVVPLVRAGAYVSFDLTPLAEEGVRDAIAAGFSGRLYSPWPAGPFRAWLGLGFGYAAAHAPGYGMVPPTSGGFFQVPLGLGSSFRLSRSFELVGEAGTRIGFGFTGSEYNRGVATGDATLGVFLVLGAAYEL
jgi:hypothetical protein